MGQLTSAWSMIREGIGHAAVTAQRMGFAMNRRRTLAMLLALGVAAPLGRPVLAAEKIRRIGYLAPSPRPAVSQIYDAFLAGLRDYGYVEGRNLAIEYRSAEGRPERLAGLARELVQVGVEVIVTYVNISTRAAAGVTRSVPIVMIVGTDVVGEGFVASLARPGGNITGLTWDVGNEVMTKRFELLKEALPDLTRIAVLWDPGQDAASFRRDIERQGAAVGATLIWPEVTDDLEPAFESAVRQGAQALFTAGGSRLYRMREKVVALAARHRLPDTHYDAAFVDAGGLMSYAPNLPLMFRRAAAYVDKILRGAKPAELPVERPTKIELVINLKTARMLGLTLPQSLLIRADRVIE